jgi:hypothetical protein
MALKIFSNHLIMYSYEILWTFNGDEWKTIVITRKSKKNNLNNTSNLYLCIIYQMNYGIL